MDSTESTLLLVGILLDGPNVDSTDSPLLLSWDYISENICLLNGVTSTGL